MILTRTLLMASAIAACASPSPPGDHGVAANLRTAVEQNTDSVLDLKVASGIRWTRVFVFGPYARMDDIQRIVGQKWTASSVQIESYDDLSYVVYVDGPRIAAELDVPYDIGIFEDPLSERGYATDSARFRVTVRGKLSGGAPARYFRHID